MNIKPIAKRVRFRIVSSGVECTSLDELKEHFEPKSVFSAIQDGRLEKWLKAIGEDKFADDMNKHFPKDLSNAEQCVEFSSFFITGKVLRRSAYKTQLEYLEALCAIKGTEDYVKHIINNIECKKDNIALLLFAYEKGFVDDVKNAFQPYVDQGYDNPVLFYVYGKVLEKEGDLKKGLYFIKKSAELGNKDAQNYLEHKNNVGIDKDKLTQVINQCFDDVMIHDVFSYFDKKFFQIIEDSRFSYLNAEMFWHASDNFAKELLNPKAYYSKEELDLLDFCRLCCKSVTTYPNDENFASGRGYSNMLRNEYFFVKTYFHEPENRYGAISNYKSMNYAPAKIRAEDLSNNHSTHIRLKNSKGSIYMQMDPGQWIYALFIYRYLTNLFNIEGSSL